MRTIGIMTQTIALSQGEEFSNLSYYGHIYLLFFSYMWNLFENSHIYEYEIMTMISNSRMNADIVKLMVFSIHNALKPQSN